MWHVSRQNKEPGCWDSFLQDLRSVGTPSAPNQAPWAHTLRAEGWSESTRPVFRTQGSWRPKPANPRQPHRLTLAGTQPAPVMSAASATMPVNKCTDWPASPPTHLGLSSTGATPGPRWDHLCALYSLPSSPRFQEWNHQRLVEDKKLTL